MKQRLPLILSLAMCVASRVAPESLSLSDSPGSSLSLAPDDFRLEMGKQYAWIVSVPATAIGKQVVLSFRARIDNPGAIGSTNMLRIQMNGATVGLRTPRRQLRLLNKPGKFAWTKPPFLTWFLTQGEWRIPYAPNFKILKTTPHYDAESYHFEMDISDLRKPGENELLMVHTGNKDIARNARSDLALVFRDLRLETRPGPGVLPGQPEKLDRNRPFAVGERRSAAYRVAVAPDGRMLLQTQGNEYEISSRFSCPGAEAIEWRNFAAVVAGEESSGEYRAGVPGKPLVAKSRQWKAVRTFDSSSPGRLLISDTFTNLTDKPIGILVLHAVRPQRGRCERVVFGGREDPNLEELNRPTTPYLFLPREKGGLGLVAYDDVLRLHGYFSYDDREQVASLRDDWFGLEPGRTYTMTWALYATATPNVFDLVNLIRRDWGTNFRIDGGINFLEPDAILADNDENLRRHLELLNINISMSQGGWVDRKLQLAGTPNVGHGPVVTGDIYADYRKRLQQAIEKLRRLRPGIRCLIYLDTWLVSGGGIRERYADSIWMGANGQPRHYVTNTEFGFPIAVCCPALNNSLGKEILAKIPTMVLDEMGADGLYWDEMAYGFDSRADFAHPDGHTFIINADTGQIEKSVGVGDLSSLPFKLELLNAFRKRGATVVANVPPTTMTEQREQFTRFSETSIPHHPGLIHKTQLYTPVSYAGYSVYHTPGVTEKDFLEDIRDKLWNANLYLFSAPMFYHLFTHENLATYQYPITPIELDEGVIIGRERLLTLRSGKFGWPGEKWRGELLLFDAEQRVTERKPTRGDKNGYVALQLQQAQAAVIVRR
ncbi:MAG: hypothetical protein GW893_06500 [Armatimonadetes bacterium]|nr:hypothetical protein [Armatimonadota bacterium]PIU64866.1 MAG: hypothetical protein COS85_10925 [Armatimonadetes bacterium CG07_land_8_20_14_0_80_59_28]